MDFRAASTWQPRAGSGEVGEAGAAKSLITLGNPPQSWGQGRAMFGGLVAAIALRPMLAVVPAERRLRTLSVSFVAPLGTEPAQCQTQALREGRALTTVESRITQEGSLRCIASGAFAADRASSIELIPPCAPTPPNDIASVEMPYMEGLMPPFVQHFKTRWDNGVYPGGGSPDGHILGACRFTSEARDADLSDVLALMDAWPPAIVTMPKTFAKSSSTVSWTIDFPQRAIEGRTTDWWAYEVRAVAATGGYGQTQAWLWDPQGRAVARSTQLVAVFE